MAIICPSYLPSLAILKYKTSILEQTTIGMTNKIDDRDSSRHDKQAHTLTQQENLLLVRQEILTRVLMRISLYVDGQDAGLDSVLKLLRDSLQEISHRDINRILERFDQAEPHIKQRREDNVQIVHDALLATVHSLQTFPLSWSLKKSIEKFVVDASQSSKKAHFYPLLLQQLAEIQQQAINEIKQAKVGLWGKLIGAHQNGEAQTIDDSVAHWINGLNMTLSSAANFPQMKEQLKSHLDNIQQTFNHYQEAASAHIRTGKIDGVAAAHVTKSMHDALTGLPNREYYMERSTHEYHRWKRYGRPLSIAVIEIDNFQKTQDEYGHQATDKVLKIIGGSIAKRLRDVDFFCRFDGEKFVALLPETTLDGAKIVLEKIRSSIARASFNYQNEAIAITLSVGTTDFKKGDELGAAFMRADELLFTAKMDGMNCIRFG